jgi:subtilase family serine protease
VNGSLKLVAPLVAALAIAACNGGSSNIPTGTGVSQTGTSAFSTHIPQWQSKHQARRVCKDLPGGGSCMVLLSTKQPNTGCEPSNGSCGLRPIDFQTRYNLGSSLSKGSGQIVAVIEMGDMPTALSDLAAYRKAFNLGTATIYKYNQYGQQSNYPASCEDWGWCLETDLDIEMVSASCPNCTIFLMEGGNCGSFVCGIEGVEKEAVALGATILSNSWGCHNGVYGPNCGDPNFPTYFDTSGIAYLASSGDSGYPEIEYPAALQSVLAVGGTQITKNGTTYNETVWSDAGAGCSAVPKPSWQHDPDCTGRTIADISADAGCDPAVAEYDSDYSGDWVGVCGTSVASPLTAGIVGLAGNPSSIVGGSTFWELSKKEHKTDLHIISSGDDGTCDGKYLCEAGLKKKHGGYETYSGPAGWGTPNGITAY